MRRDVLVYISGPMTANTRTGATIEEHTVQGFKAYIKLLQLGIPAFCPHLSGAFPSAWTAIDHTTWLAYDKAIIDRCTHLLMVGNWHESKGAVIEREYALARQLPVAYSITSLLDSLDYRVGAADGEGH